MNRKKIIKSLKWVILILIAVPLLLIFLTQLKSVQNAAANKAVSWLSEKLGTEVKLNDISWKRLNNLEINGFLIRDQQADTLLAANQLIVKFNFWGILRSEFLIDEVNLSGALARISRDKSDTWNFKFISDAFPPGVDTSQQATQFVIQPNLINLNKIRFDYSDAISASQLNVKLEDAAIRVDHLDIYQQQIALQTVVLDRPNITYISAANAPVIVDTLPTTYSFPDIGWEIFLDEMQLKEGMITYRESQKESLPEGIFNPEDLNIKHLSWDIRKLQTTDSLIRASIQSFSLEEKSGLQISELQTDVNFSNRNASLQGFHLLTPNSKIDQSISIEYPDIHVLEIFSNERSKYNPADIIINADLVDIRISPIDFRRFAPDVLPIDQDGLISLNGSVNGNLSNLNLSENIYYPAIDLRVSAQGQIIDLLDIEKVYLDLFIDTAFLDYAKLGTILPSGSLPKEFESWGSIDLKGRVVGKLADFETNNLRLNTRSGPQFKGDVQISGLPEYKTAIYNLEIDQFSTKTADWAGFLPDTIPDELKNIESLVLRGSFLGSIYKFKTDLRFELAEGTILTNTSFDFKEDYSNAFYQGNIQLAAFDAGAFLQDSSLGVVNLDMNIDGQGLQLADLDTEIQSVLIDQVYQQYKYDSLFLNGHLDSSAFVGFINMQDPNLAFDFDGRIPFNDSISSYKFTLQLDTINLKPLGFYTTPIGLSTYMELDLQNYYIDDLKGSLVMTDLNIRDSLNTFYADSIFFNSTVDATGHRELAFDSKWLQLGLEGQYTLSQLPKELLDWLDQDFPINTIFFSSDSTNIENEVPEEYASSETNIKAYLRLNEELPLSDLFIPELKKLDRIDLNLEFNKAAERWNLKTESPRIEYADYQIDSLSLVSYYDDKKLTNELTTTRFQSGENTVIYNPTLQAILKNDSLRLEFWSSESPDSVSWRIGGALTSNNEEIFFQVNPKIRLNGESWNINPKNQLIYSAANEWQINQLGLSKDSGSVILNGSGRSADSSSIVKVDFNQFNISALTPFLDLPTGYMQGTLDGVLNAKDLQTSLNYTAKLELKNWMMDSILIGDLNLFAQQLTNQPVIKLSMALRGLVNKLDVAGNYDIQKKLFDVKAVIGRMEMQSLDPFLPGLIHDSDGYLTGDFTLKGSPDFPSLNGLLQLNELKTTIDYLNAPYTIEKGAISFTEKVIDFGDIRMRDANDQQAKLSGVINHRNFSDMTFDLRFQTDRFQFLNTTAKDNKLFYGKLILESDTEIQGPFEQPRFFIRAKTETGTKFFVVPLSDEQVLSQDDFIIYGVPTLDSLGRDTSLINASLENNSGIDLKLNLEMTSDASLEIIIDPLTGDKLLCKGISNLAVDMGSDGSLSVFGNYQITEGQYSFSYEQLLKREFSILPNSNISFNGDPLDAQLDITAAYQLRVPLSDLVEGQLIDENISLAGQRADVQVQMKISGNLKAPVLSFDIILLGNPQGTVADAARTRLQQLRNDETGLNTQVFGLLLFNSFISPSNSDLSVSSAGETALLSSLSKLVTNELNRLASGLLKGVDFRLGVEAYKPGVDGPGNDGITTEVQLGVSKRLWNDRLNVTVGGNINVGNTGQEQQGLTALTGDFALEYQLTTDGNYLLRVYQRSDYDALYEGNVNRAGAGISIRRTLPNKEKKHQE